MMDKDKENNTAPLLHVRTTGQPATSSERVVVQTNTPTSRDASVGSAKLTHVVSSSAGGVGDKPTKRIGAADLEKILGAEAAAALDRIRRHRRSS